MITTVKKKTIVIWSEEPEDSSHLSFPVTSRVFLAVLMRLLIHPKSPRHF